jgi:hypothetical protein
VARKRHHNLGADPASDQPAPNVPEAYPEDMVPPEAPTGLDPSDTPILSDSPRRAMSPGRFGNPMKDKMSVQPANSDSPTDDDPMEPTDERAERDADFPGDDESGAEA